MAIEKDLIKEYTGELLQDPDSLVIVPLAKTYRQTGLLNAAIRLCIQGIKRHPKHVGLYVILGQALLEKALTKEARNVLQTVLKMDPGNEEAKELLTQVLQEETTKSQSVPRAVPPTKQLETMAMPTPISLSEEKISELKPTPLKHLLSLQDIDFLQRLLEELTELPEVLWSILAGQDGLVFLNAPAKGVDFEEISARAVFILVTAERSLKSMGLGSFEGGWIEGEQKFYYFISAGQFTLIASTTETVNLGLVKGKVWQTAAEIKTIIERSSSSSL